MAYPPPVPTLSSEEFEEFLEQLDSFELSDEQKQRVEKHRQALRDD